MEENNNDGYFKGLFTGIAIGAIIVLLTFSIIQYGNIGSESNDKEDIIKNENEVEELDLNRKIETILANIDSIYMDEYDKEAMEDAVCKALLESLGDPYSCYYNEEDLESLMEGVTGKYCGIGVAAGQNADTGKILITTTFKTGSAYEAGIKPGDEIIGVDDTNIEGYALDKVVAMIKGEENTEVTIKILREGEEMDFTLKRKIIEIDTVYYRMIDEVIGYIQLTEFDEISITQFSEAVDELKAQGMEKIIVDIRDNPGGRMDVVCDIVNTFLDKDKLILYTEDKYGKREEQFTSKDGELIGIELVVLVNGNSASASEVFSGVVKDYKIGTVVGTQTFGKGIVQRILPIKDGSALKLTYSKYYTPNGINIHGTGIEPDVIVELPEDAQSPLYISEEEDTQLKKAIELLK